MAIRRLEDRDVPLVAAWLGEHENHRWLWFGPGVQTLAAPVVRMMAHRDQHMIRVFDAGDGGPPVGVVALSDVDRAFGTATLWYVLGEVAYRRRGLTTRAVHELLTEGFGAGLSAIAAWAVDANGPSIRVLERNAFRFVGRQRRCHVVDGRPRDRLHFDLLASEHEVLR
jgi:RimJ/RimL family protein N-acetyltransferase